MPETTKPICILDDDSSVLSSLQELLASDGLEAETFDSQDIFLAYTQEHAVKLAVLDVWLGQRGETLEDTKLVIFLISPAFLSSRFCLAESGATWVKSVDQIILLTPSLNSEDLGGIFDGIQAAKLNDQYALNELKDKICNAVSPQPQVNANHWERVRNEFLNYVAKAPSLPEKGPRRDWAETSQLAKFPE
jgi:hypothetical protein